MTDTQPKHGDRVTYFDGGGNAHPAIVIDPVEDAEFITCVTGDGATIGKSYVSKVDTHTSVYPHSDLGSDYTAETYAFKPGWLTVSDGDDGGNE